MVENQTTQKEFTVLDLFKMILKKTKLIAWITLLALVLGAAGGVAMALISNATYGARADFYVYSAESNSYILSLLRSDSFAERLLLDENGLPEDKKGTKAYEAAKEAKDALDAKLEEIKQLEQDVKLYPAKVAKAQRKLSDAKTNYDTWYNQWNTYMSVQDSKLLADLVDVETAQETIEKLEKALDDSKKEYAEATAAYDEIANKSLAADEKLLISKNELPELRDAKNDAYNKALSEFRNDSQNIETMQSIRKAITFEYVNSDKEKATESKAQLYVHISVKFDREFAQELLSKITEILPDFVEESVVAEGDARETECVFLSVFGTVDSVDYKNPIKQAIMFGVVAAIAAMVVACFVIIVGNMLKASEPATISAPVEHPVLDEEKEQDEEPKNTDEE